MQIIIIAPQGAGKVTVAEKIRAALGDQFTIVAETPLMVSPSPLNEIFGSNESWVPLSSVQRREAAEMPEFAVPFLGHLPDTFIAKHIGWAYSAVRARRMRLGMAACDVGRPPRSGEGLREQIKQAFLDAKKAAGFVTPVEE
jgi:hypothetical protein